MYNTELRPIRKINGGKIVSLRYHPTHCVQGPGQGVPVHHHQPQALPSHQPPAGVRHT